MSKWKDRENKLLARLPHTQTNPNQTEGLTTNEYQTHKYLYNMESEFRFQFFKQSLIIYAEQMLSNRPQQNYV